jgi:hypothetical protein
MSDPLFWFLGAVSGGIASAFFWVLARRAEDKVLARGPSYSGLRK